MDFSANEVHKGIVLEEFRNKYSESYVNINGNPDYILDINADGITFNERGVITFKEYAEITNITLKSGIYMSKDNKSLVYIYKYPTRQFCKGIKFGTTHGFTMLSGSNKVPNLNINFVGYYTIFNNNVFIYRRLIGEIKDDTIELAAPFKHLRQEAEELWKQYRIF